MRRWGIKAFALISWLAVALNQGMDEEIQPFRRQAKRPRVQANWDSGLLSTKGESQYPINININIKSVWYRISCFMQTLKVQTWKVFLTLAQPLLKVKVAPHRGNSMDTGTVLSEKWWVPSLPYAGSLWDPEYSTLSSTVQGPSETIWMIQVDIETLKVILVQIL